MAYTLDIRPLESSIVKSVQKPVKVRGRKKPMLAFLSFVFGFVGGFLYCLYRIAKGVAESNK